jgi:hypothetical protein
MIATRIPSNDRTIRYFNIEKKRLQEQNEKAIEAGKEAKQSKQIAQDIGKDEKK